MWWLLTLLSEVFTCLYTQLRSLHVEEQRYQCARHQQTQPDLTPNLHVPDFSKLYRQDEKP